MKLPADTLIAHRKISDYLLACRLEDDKSAFLARAGYVPETANRLLADLRTDLARGVHFDDRACQRQGQVCHALPRQDMKYKMFSRVALKANLPKPRLRRGDVATIVEAHAGRPDQEPGYTLEVFNAVGDTVGVVTLRESQIEPLTAKSVLHVRPLLQAV